MIFANIITSLSADDVTFSELLPRIFSCSVFIFFGMLPYIVAVICGIYAIVLKHKKNIKNKSSATIKPEINNENIVVSNESKSNKIKKVLKIISIIIIILWFLFLLGILSSGFGFLLLLPISMIMLFYSLVLIGLIWGIYGIVISIKKSKHKKMILKTFIAIVIIAIILIIISIIINQITKISNTKKDTIGSIAYNFNQQQYKS